MKGTLKNIGFAFLGAAILLVVISFFLSGELNITRKQQVTQPPPAVFAQINTVAAWKTWWTSYTPTEGTNATYTSKTEGQGAGFTWTNDGSEGEGRVAITESEPNQRVQIEAFYPGTAEPRVIDVSLREIETGTEVTMSMQVVIPWSNISGKYAGIFMDDMVGKEFELSLEQLNTLFQRAGE